MYTGHEGTRSLGRPSCHPRRDKSKGTGTDHGDDTVEESQHRRGEGRTLEGLGRSSHVQSPSVQSRNQQRTVKRRSTASMVKSITTIALLASTVPVAMAQKCVSLSGSKACPAFNESSVSTDGTLASQFPFLSFVSDVGSFDQRIMSYITTTYAQLKYQDLLGCGNINLTNTTQLYARYTTSVLCNALVQNSKGPCSLSDADSMPLCADTCAQQATSEQQIISMNETCSNPGRNALDQIRADFTVCALPSSSLSGNCISGASNEPDSCGYSTNLIGLCTYCAKSSPNATDSCCYHADLSKCDSIHIPATSALQPLFPNGTTTSTPSASNSSSSTSSPVASGRSGLSGGQIAGVVVGSIVGAALLAALLVALCIFLRRRRGSQSGSIFNQPTPARKSGNGMAFNPVAASVPNQQGYEVLPGGRIARMSALEGTSGHSPPRGDGAAVTAGIGAGGAAGAAAGGIAGARRRHMDNSSSDDYGESPDSRPRGAPLRAPPTGTRNGSLSSASALNALDSSPGQSGSGGEFSSPQGVASQQSEQLPYFKDYYSQDDIHPNSKVSTLWAYQPRAGDEFELERGDMLKVVGIWDDGWATGVRLNERAEDWDAKHKIQRDSGVSNGSGRRGSSPPPPGEIKAFPLVCVCLPEHWKKTIEGDGSTETGSTTAGNPLTTP